MNTQGNQSPSSGQSANTSQQGQQPPPLRGWHGLTLGEVIIALSLYVFCFVACLIGFLNPGNVVAAIFASFGVCVGVFVSNSSFTDFNNAVHLFLVASLNNFLSSRLPSLLPWFLSAIVILEKLALILILLFTLVRINTSHPLVPIVHVPSQPRCYHTQIIPNISPSIGISDGCFAFDTMRANGDLKKQAANMLKKNHAKDAEKILQQAQKEDTSDAEASIYLENQKVLDSKRPYVTFVIAAPITGPYADLGAYDLQAAYLVQKYYNADPTHKQLLRLAVANTGGQENQCSQGSQVSYAEQVAQLIAREVKKDRTIVAIMGSPIGTESATIIKVLQDANVKISMVSTASDDDLTNISDYLYSIAPSNNDQAMAMFQYAQTLRAKKVALFVDVCDGYSNNLAMDIQKAFGSSIAITLEPYTVGEPETIQAGLKAALKAKPDLIVFPGRAREVNVLLNDTNMPMTGLILGGSALYEVGEYNGNANTRFQLLRFTSPAYPDEWSVLGHQQQMPAFFKEYSQVFDPDGVHSIRPYGYSRPTAEVMLAFDAMSLLLNAGRGNFTVESILSGLRHTMGSQAWPGVAGSIAFKLASSHELSNKTVLLLWVDKNGNIQMLLPKGRVCFLAADCTYENNNDGIIYMKTHLFSVLNSLIKGITISHNFSSLPARSCHNTFRHNCKANVRKTLVGRQRA